jgi:hypothetical protein
MTTIDVSTEELREYHYADGSIFAISEPLTVHVLADDRGVSHRVEAADGKTYRPERGWVGISWRPKAGEPPFVA